LAPDLPLLILALMSFGALLGLLDVSMNANGTVLEQRLGRPILSALHGLYAIAGMLAALCASLFIGTVPEGVRLAGVASVLVVLVLVAGPMLLPVAPVPRSDMIGLRMPSTATWRVGSLCFVALMIEGAVIDWAGIYLRQEFGMSARATSGLAALFFGTLALMRLLGDRLRAASTPWAMLAWSAGLTTVFLGVAVVSPVGWIALVAFGLSGGALGLIAPIVFAAGGQTEPSSAGRGVAVVITMGYVGFMLGPALVGTLAEVSALSVSLSVIAVLPLIIVSFRRWVPPHQTS
jgi:hypothetical protein